MSKQEFLDGLSKALSATGSNRLIEQNISYYNNYIDTEVGKGRSETEVMSELGDPRLIAKSIMDAAGYDSTVSDIPEDYQGNYTKEDGYDNDGNRESYGFHMHTIKGWQVTLVLILIAVVVIALFWLVGTIIGGILSVIGPILGPIFAIMVIMWFIKIFRD